MHQQYRECKCVLQYPHSERTYTFIFGQILPWNFGYSRLYLHRSSGMWNRTVWQTAPTLRDDLLSPFSPTLIEAAETLVLKLSEYMFSLSYLTNIGRLKSPQILPNQSGKPWFMEIIIQATILSVSNLFYLRSTEHYFHTHSQLEFLFQPHNHAALKIFKIWPPWYKHNRRQTVHANWTNRQEQKLRRLKLRERCRWIFMSYRTRRSVDR
jgi:hypothetical protein